MTSDPSIHRMGHYDFIVHSFMGNPIGPKMVKF